MSSNESFLSRWSRRKHDSRVAGDAAGSGSRDVAKGAAPLPAADELQRPAAGEALPPATEGVPRDGRGCAEPLPELPPIDSLTPASDFRPFMQEGVDADTRNAALAKLFRDPHFSLTDGLDVYIDDYNETEPIPPALLAGLKQLHTIGLSDDEIERMREGDEVASAALAGPRQAGPEQESAAGDEAATGPPGGQAAQLGGPAARLGAGIAEPGPRTEQAHSRVEQFDPRAEPSDPRAEPSDPGAEQSNPRSEPSDPQSEPSDPRDAQRVRKT